VLEPLLRAKSQELKQRFLDFQKLLIKIVFNIFFSSCPFV